MKKLLLTAFDPFAHYQINPSWEAVKSLPEVIADYQISKILLPNIYGLAANILLEKAEDLKPDIILMTGMNSASVKLELNLTALNIRDTLIEDNLGKKPWNEPIIINAPAAYFSTIPIHDIFKKMRLKGLPVRLAYACGAYVCNDIFYSALHKYSKTSTLVGFVHVPLLPQMVFDENMALPLDKTVETLSAIIESI